MTIIINPGAVSMADWRSIYHGATPLLDKSCFTKIEESAAAVARILARQKPVYGINTGFGKLANVKIENEDLLALQRNIVLSHAAGIGDLMPIEIARLMMALKLSSLAQGASGVKLQTIDMLGKMLENGLTPAIPAQGSVGASGDLAPLAHLAAAMIGTGEIWHLGVRKPAIEALENIGLAPLILGPQRGVGAIKWNTVFVRVCACWTV